MTRWHKCLQSTVYHPAMFVEKSHTPAVSGISYRKKSRGIQSSEHGGQFLILPHPITWFLNSLMR